MHSPKITQSHGAKDRWDDEAQWRDARERRKAIKDEIERTHKEVQGIRQINYRLEVEQVKNIDTLNKNSDNYKTDETLGLKQIKAIKEEIQRIHLQAFDKERAIDNC